MKYSDLFPVKPVIGLIHLAPLPGAPLYGGRMEDIFARALSETDILVRSGVHGLIIENFGDMPFYPDAVPAETIAAMTAVSREVVRAARVPIGINVLRNDAEAAIAIANAVQAHFIRVNVHTGISVTDQGLIPGLAHRTLRLRKNLQSEALIFADVAVKHAKPLVDRGIALETMDLDERGLADAIIITGDRTGGEIDLDRIDLVRASTKLPLLAGSGVTIDNSKLYRPKLDGFIIGSYFKLDGKAMNSVDPDRAKLFMDCYCREP